MMKVHAFKVEKTDQSSDLEEILAQISRENNLRDRIRMINHVEIRAESIIERENLWYMDFVRIRTDHGPGRVGRDREIEGFDFEPEEGFGEETAALYDPRTRYVLIQYNHFGVRAGTIADYLSDYAQNNLYTFKPKFDNDVERRLVNQGITRKVAFTLDVSKLSEQDRQRGQPLSEAIDYGRSVGADKIKIEIAVQGERHRGLAQRARDGVHALQNILGLNPDAVTKLEVAGKNDRDAVTEVLDLISHRLSIEFDDLQLGEDRRYPRDQRWDALLRAKNGWNRILQQ